MKPLTGAAVLGLLPIPPPPAIHPLGDKGDIASAREKAYQAMCFQREAAERQATAEELARLRRALGLGVKAAARNFGSGRRS